MIIFLFALIGVVCEEPDFLFPLTSADDFDFAFEVVDAAVDDLATGTGAVADVGGAPVGVADGACAMMRIFCFPQGVSAVMIHLLPAPLLLLPHCKLETFAGVATGVLAAVSAAGVGVASAWSSPL